MSRSLRARSRPVRPDALVMAAAIALAAGCGGKVVLDGGSTAGSTGTGGTDTTFVCDRPQDVTHAHLCVTITNPGSAMLPALESECAADGGTMLDACATTNLLGLCTETVGGLMQVTSFYTEGGALSVSEAQASCASAGGTWTAE
jgi:hypothetical protein